MQSCAHINTLMSGLSGQALTRMVWNALTNLSRSTCPCVLIYAIKLPFFIHLDIMDKRPLNIASPINASTLGWLSLDQWYSSFAAR